MILKIIEKFFILIWSDNDFFLNAGALKAQLKWYRAGLDGHTGEPNIESIYKFKLNFKITILEN